MIGALRVKISFNIYCVGSVYEAFCESLYLLVYGELRIEATSIRFFKKLVDCVPSAIACMLMLHMLIYVSRFIDIRKTRLFKYIENFTSKNRKLKNSDIFHISAQNIDCGYSLELPRRDSSNEYLQSMFLSRNKKNNVYPCKPQFYYIKVGFKGVKIK